MKLENENKILKQRLEIAHAGIINLQDEFEYLRKSYGNLYGSKGSKMASDILRQLSTLRL